MDNAMSRKQALGESSNDEQKNEDSCANVHQEVYAKSGKFSSVSDTTRDLPTEMIMRILVKAVAMEVKDMKLPKGSVWKEKGDLVINRLRTVCSQWNFILTTTFFRNELRRALSVIAPETIRMEILHQSVIDCLVMRVSTLKGELLVLNSNVDTTFNIRVYDRNNMTSVKDVIVLLPGERGPLADMAACNVTDCIYALEQHLDARGSSIFRIKRDERHQSHVQTWISDLSYSFPYMNVSAEGRLIIISPLLSPEGLRCGNDEVSIFDTNGSLQRVVVLSPDIYGFLYSESVMEKPDGNLVISYVDQQHDAGIMEINMNGIIERKHKLSSDGGTNINFADTSGRILANHWQFTIVLLDSELNELDYIRPQPDQDDFHMFCGLHHNRERNEVVGFHVLEDANTVLTIFRFNEE